MSKRTKWLSLIGIIAALVVGWQVVALAGPVGDASGFEDDDGNLAVNSTFDWNGFAPTTWTGTAPYRVSSKVASGWTFKGIQDDANSNTDTAFAGGVKQDQDCPSVIGAKAPNKDDLRRIYLATKNVGGDIYLNLAWVRIAQNTTSPSAHVAFEFNKGSTSCGAGSRGLVHRTAGDMLIVYDFEGGATDAPTLTLRRWITSGSCEISSDSAPCWGQATNLTAGGFAEGKVNTFGAVNDTINPSGSTQSLGKSEFGEAGINLTDAGVFTPGTCETFGTAFGVSRSSGNSGTAQMKDLVGPGDFTLSNCATVITRKVTDPSGDTTTNFGYTTNVTTTPSTTTSPFSLKDGGSNTITSVNPGQSLNVTEDAPGSNYQLASIDCSASTVPSGNRSTDTTTRAVTFSIAAGETLDCTFTNKLQQGAIKVTKTRKHAADGPRDHPQSGVSFTVNGVTKQTNANGQACFDNLSFGDYTVHETVPAGYHVDGNDKSVTVDNSASCSDSTYGGETVSFHNTPLSNITVSFASQVPGGTASKISCTNLTADPADGTPNAFDDTSETFKNLEPGTYDCTVVVDP